MRDTGEQPHRCDLGRGGEEGGDRGRGAFVYIWRPHVERHGRHFERKARNHEHKPKQQANRCVAIPGCGDDASEQGGSGKAIDQRCAIEQKTRRQGTKDKVLQPGLGRFYTVTAQRRNDVERKRLKFEAHIERHQIAGRNHHHHPHGRKGDKQRVFEFQDVAPGQVFLPHDQHGRGGKQDHHLGKSRKPVVDEHTAKGRLRIGGTGGHDP